MNLAMVKRKAATPWKSTGVHFAEQLRTTGNAFRFCAEQILVASPIGSRLTNVRLLPVHSYTRRLGRWHQAIGPLLYKWHDIAHRECIRSTDKSCTEVLASESLRGSPDRRNRDRCCCHGLTGAAVAASGAVAATILARPALAARQDALNRAVVWESGVALMTKILILVISLAINASTSPAVASECASTSDLASHVRWNAVRDHLKDPSDIEKTCRAYAASFSQIVVTRHAATICGVVGRQRDLALIDSEINAVNDLMAAKCGG
jgi:hypothetical protein